MDAVRSGFGLGCQIIKEICYNNFTSNLEDCYNKRTDLRFLKTFFVGAIGAYSSVKVFLYKKPLHPGLNSLFLYIKGLSAVVDVFPKFVYSIIQIAKTRNFSVILEKKGSFYDKVWVNAMTGMKFCKDLGEGLSFIDIFFKPKFITEVNPRLKSIASFLRREDLMGFLAVANAVQTFKCLNLTNIQAAAKFFSNENEDKKAVNEDKKAVNDRFEVAEKLLKGVNQASFAVVCFSKFFKKNFDTNRYLGFAGTVAMVTYSASSIFANRWKFMACK